MAAGFTLIEMLVSIAIMVILMAIIFQAIQFTATAWKQSSQGSVVVQQARTAFERMTRQLSQATLNTYYDYYYPPNSSKPQYYLRQSQLQFISGYGPSPTADSTTPFVPGQITQAVFFQAPLGITNTTAYGNLDNLLNACGYYIMYGTDPTRPTFLSSLANSPPDSYRYRLFEYLPPAEDLNVYATNPVTPNTAIPSAWITPAPTASPPTARPLASNIVALIILPEEFLPGTTTNGQANVGPITTSSGYYNYDSTQGATTHPQPATANQMPPLVKVVMVAIDESSGTKLANIWGTTVPNLGQSQLFHDPSALFTPPGGSEGDLEKFEDVLNAKPGNIVGNKVKLTYSIFQTDVAIRESKWSQ